MENEIYTKRILVVDDNKNTLEIILRNLKIHNFSAIGASCVQEAVEILSKSEIGLLVTDNKMPQITGMELIKYVRDHYPEIGIIMVTGYASINGAVDAIKEGADEYIAKPFSDNELIDAVKKTIRAQTLRPFSNYHKLHEIGLMGYSLKMVAVFRLIEKACLNDVTVLITGDSGTGKELVARAIHYLHNVRATAPFIAVNCPGIPETLFESELFGHVKGAFTGAIENKNGFFTSANKGTIFLDEISELSISMQSKLLRALQEKTICKVGAGKSESIDVRIIAASNKNLEEMIKKEQFREDLFYRLNVLNIHVPPLRDRIDDIEYLVKHFTNKYSKQFKQKVPKFSESAINALKSYSWPGNIRELENIIQRSLIVTDRDVIDSSDFPDKLKCNLIFPMTHIRSLKEVEKEHLIRVLDSVKGNKTKAAEILGIDRKTLRDKLS